nr:hypothetical protein [Tanacetum cinerariifolium]
MPVQASLRSLVGAVGGYDGRESGGSDTPPSYRDSTCQRGVISRSTGSASGSNPTGNLPLRCQAKAMISAMVSSGQSPDADSVRCSSGVLVDPALFQHRAWPVGRCATVALQFLDVQADRHQTCAQVVQLTGNQLRAALAFRPQLAGQ